jgi:hypothetical protein
MKCSSERTVVLEPKVNSRHRPPLHVSVLIFTSDILQLFFVSRALKLLRTDLGLGRILVRQTIIS